MIHRLHNLKFNAFTLKTFHLNHQTPRIPLLTNGSLKCRSILKPRAHAYNNQHEVVITVTATVTTGKKTAFLIEVHQAGVFVINGFPNDQLHQMLGSFCPNVLFPYAREVISDTVVRGGFPQLILAPVNFDALYAQHMEQQGKESKEKGDGAN